MSNPSKVDKSRELFKSVRELPKNLMSIKETSQVLNVRVNTLYGWVCQRKIPYIKLGRLVRFDAQDIDKWIQDQKVNELKF